MNPDRPDKQTGPNDPMFGAPFQQPENKPVVTSSPGPAEPAGNGPAKSKLPLAIGVLAVVELLVIIVLTVAVAGKSNKPSTTTTTNGSDSAQAQGPTAATSANTQLIDDSITQDISGLNDDKDFPADKFSDNALGL